MQSENTSVNGNKRTTNESSDASKNQDGHLYYIVAGAVGGIVFLVAIIGIVIFVWIVSFIFKFISMSPEEMHNSKEKSVNNCLVTKFNGSITQGRRRTAEVQEINRKNKSNPAYGLGVEERLIELEVPAGEQPETLHDDNVYDEVREDI